MAKRRVNTKFLVIFTVIVVGGVLALLVVAGPLKPLIMRGDRVEKLLIAGDESIKASEAATDPQQKKEKLEVALRSFSQAAQQSTKDPKIWVKIGDVYNQLTRFDFRASILASRGAWEKALEIDPTHAPALRRLQDSYYQELGLSRGNVVAFKNVRERSESLLKLDPTDLKAASLKNIAVIHQWLSNVETPAHEVDAAIRELGELVQKDPSNAENVFYVAAAKGKRAAEEKRLGRDEAANALFKESVDIFQQAIKAQPDHGQMHYRFHVLLQVIRGENRTNTSAVQLYSRMLDEAVKRMKETAKPSDPKYVEIMIAAHQYALTKNERQEAERILRDMMASPELAKDQRVRLALVKMYKFDRDPNKRDEALRLLQEEMQDIGWTGPEAWRRVGLEIDTLIERANMNIDRIATAPAAERKAKLAEIEKTYEQAVSAMTRANMPGEDSRLLKVRGKIELLRGGNDAPIKAIQTFEKAAAAYRIETGNNREDLDLMYLLARAYYASRQTGQARQLLDRFVYQVKDFVPARVMLAELLLAEGSPELARDHVEYLRQNAPDLPEVVKLVLQTLDVNKPEERARVKENYDKLPEETPEDAVAKAVVAQRPPVSNTDDAIRLYRKSLASKPGEFQVLDALHRALVAQGKKDEAIKAMEEGLASATAEDKDKINLVLTQLRGGSEEAVGKAAEDLIRKQFANDPLGRELRLYEFETVRSGREAAVKHLLEAEKIKGDDGRVLDLVFRHHVEQQNWAKAQEYVEKLAKINWDQADGLVYRFRLAMVRTDHPDKQKRADARRYTDEMKQKLPEFARSWVFSAQAWMSGGDYVEAISDFQMALEKQSNNTDALLGIINCCYQLKRYGDAGRYIDKALEQHPNDGRFRQLKRDFEMAHGDPTRIFKEAKDERDANPKDVNGWVALGRAYLSAGINKPGDPNSKKYIEEAKKVFRDALVQFPGERMVWANLVQVAEHEKDLAGAELVLKEMAKREQFKDSPDPLKWLAEFYLRSNQVPLAEATMKSAVERFKDRVDVRRELAAFYTQQKRFDEALKLLDPSSTDKQVRQQIVEIYMLAGAQGAPLNGANGFVEAEKLLRGLLQTEGREGQLHALLGVVLLNQGKREQALDAMNAALDLDPKNATALFSRGQLYMTAKPPQIDAATRDFQNLRDVAPNHVEARVSLADAYKRKYRNQDALKELEVAIRLAPSRRDVRVNLLDLYTKGRTPNWADSERLLKDVIDAEPKEVLWRRMLAKMYSARKQGEKAAVTIREAFALEPTNGELVRDYLEILETGKYWQLLETECDRLLHGDKNLADKAWWIYVKRGTAKRYRDNKAGAMEDFMTAFKITTGDAESASGGITSTQVHVVEKMAEHLDKVQAIRRAEQLAGNDPRWKVVLAYLHNLNMNRERAISLIEEVRGQMANATDQDKMVTLNVAGQIYMANDEYDRARGVYQDMLKIRKDDIAVLNNIACIMAEFGSSPDPKGALNYSKQAYDLMINRQMSDPNILDTHGWVNVLCGGAQIDAGIEHLTEAIKAADMPEAHYHLGEAMLKKNLPEDAVRSLTRAQEILKEREEKGQPVDSKLRQRIEEALVKADNATKSNRVAGQ